MQDLNVEINELVENIKDDVSILIKDMKNNKIIYSKNENKKIISASTIKVQIMLAALVYLKDYGKILDNCGFKTII